MFCTATYNGRLDFDFNGGVDPVGWAFQMDWDHPHQIAYASIKKSAYSEGNYLWFLDNTTLMRLQFLYFLVFIRFKNFLNDGSSLKNVKTSGKKSNYALFLKFSASENGQVRKRSLHLTPVLFKIVRKTRCWKFSIMYVDHFLLSRGHIYF